MNTNAVARHSVNTFPCLDAAIGFIETLVTFWPTLHDAEITLRGTEVRAVITLDAAGGSPERLDSLLADVNLFARAYGRGYQRGRA
jgi:hypothetical protein